MHRPPIIADGGRRCAAKFELGKPPGTPSASSRRWEPCMRVISAWRPDQFVNVGER